ncbi:glycoside hydrolase family 127 protein [Evansella tamaricis]|uniref:Glycoside hydrolase family 127 protein n=1 Tax=Evansella tamaricis TaxID=2069301 RepID=A0ABS6JE45_9BACI|nr:glycoside hydrolase family 127 protein [Evansella tamaricis]MBU9711946.1 glycoside hydrolase family 127 protein [Evansella tamaricis]
MDYVTLLDGVFKESQEKGKDYLLYLEVDRLMAPCYEAAGQKPKAPRYGGWESTGISGHSIGHWLSATAQMYAITLDKTLKQKLDYAIGEFAYLQHMDEKGYVGGFPRDCFDKTFTGQFEVERFSLAGQWVPWYSLHKVFAGLLDSYRLTGSSLALEVVMILADWAKQGSDQLTEEQFQRMLFCEHGGMTEAMADLYSITGKKDYLHLAIRFCHEEVLGPLSEGRDELEGKHANTQIPKLVGAAKLYNITGQQKYKEMCVNFWELVTNTRSYIIGGNSINEHFGPAGQEKLGVQSAETCNTYNMLKLTECLFEWFKEGKYMDFYERALYNHILASQDPESGMKTYFVSTQPGHFKVYSSPDNSFWCCTGTGMENPARYTRSIYHGDYDGVFVNLFIPSKAALLDNKVQVRQETDFPASEKSKLIFEKGNATPFKLHIRVPYWSSGEVTVMVNGIVEQCQSKKGYVIIERTWNTGDEVEVHLPLGLHTYQAKDNLKKHGIMYGPIVLAGALGRENFPEKDILADHLKLNNHPLIKVPTLVADKNNLNEWIKKRNDKNLIFQTEGVGQPGNHQITLVPFYNLHHERYTLYWNLMTKEEFKHFVDEEQEELERFRSVTVDEVQPNEQQPEVEHGLKSENSASGYSNIVQKGWRDAKDNGFFRYELAVKPDKKMVMEVSYFGGDHNIVIGEKTFERKFDILIDGNIIATQILENSGAPASTMEIQYLIPEELTLGKKSVEVKFACSEGKIAGGVYGIRMIVSG